MPVKLAAGARDAEQDCCRRQSLHLLSNVPLKFAFCGAVLLQVCVPVTDAPIIAPKYTQLFPSLAVVCCTSMVAPLQMTVMSAAFVCSGSCILWPRSGCILSPTYLPELPPKSHAKFQAALSAIPITKLPGQVVCASAAFPNMQRPTTNAIPLYRVIGVSIPAIISKQLLPARAAARSLKSLNATVNGSVHPARTAW